MKRKARNVGRRRRPSDRGKKRKHRVKLTRRDIVFLAICVGAVALLVIAAPLLFKPKEEAHLTELYTHIGSADNKIFHQPDCRWVKWIEADDLIQFKSREEAVASGQKPCAVCTP